MSNVIDLSPRIILIENDAIFAESALIEFERDGYLIKWLINSDDILNIIEHFIPNIIILNWNFVSESCLKLIAEIRLNQSLNEMKLIVTVDLYSGNNAIRALSVGADDYLSKPITEFDLLARVWVHLRSWRIVYKTIENNYADELFLDKRNTQRLFVIKSTESNRSRNMAKI